MTIFALSMPYMSGSLPFVLPMTNEFFPFCDALQWCFILKMVNYFWNTLYMMWLSDLILFLRVKLYKHTFTFSFYLKCDGKQGLCFWKEGERLAPEVHNSFIMFNFLNQYYPVGIWEYFIAVQIIDDTVDPNWNFGFELRIFIQFQYCLICIILKFPLTCLNLNLNSNSKKSWYSDPPPCDYFLIYVRYVICISSSGRAFSSGSLLCMKELK